MATVVISFSHNGSNLETTVNAIINNPNDFFVTESMISSAQVQAQVQLATSLNAQPEVSFVHINSISYLGNMTETQFLDKSKAKVDQSL